MNTKKLLCILTILMQINFASFGQNLKEETMKNKTAESIDGFINSLKEEEVSEYKGSPKKVILAEAAFSTNRNSNFLEMDQIPEYDQMKNLLNGQPYLGLKNKEIMFKGIKTENAKFKLNNAIKSENIDVFQFAIDGKPYKMVALSKADVKTMLFAHLFDANYLQQIKTGLEGKTLYTNTSEWNYRTPNEGINEAEIENDVSCKYCAVTITKVAKEQIDNYTLYFKAKNNPQEYFFNVILNRTNSYGMNTNIKEEFLNFLSFDNPKEKVENVSDKKWESIKNLKIEKGMTKDEIQLMLGKPDQIMKGDLQKPNQEYWYYSNVNRKFYEILFSNDKVEKYLIHQ